MRATANNQECLDETMSNTDIQLKEIERLIRLVETHHLTELIVEEGGTRIRIRGAGYAARPRPVSAQVPQEEALFIEEETFSLSSAASEAPAPSAHSGLRRVAVEAPMIGVFYRSSGPDQPPFVEVGDTVEVGQTIGLIEAMKVFSEIPCEQAGRVVEIVAANGKLVRTGEPLIYLEVDDGR
jgi:acetyl-CoA carboxylase biotin carboxyl carrier protein